MKRNLVLIYLVLLTLSGISQNKEPLRIFHKPISEGGFAYFAENVDYAPYQLEINFAELKNLKPSVSLPFYTVVYPGDTQALFELVPKGSGNTSFRSGFNMTLGDPEAEVDQNYVYQLPFEEGQSFLLSQGTNGPYTHQGKYAWDFLMDEGTPVCASRPGIVVTVKEDSNQGGGDPSFMDMANRITILHQDGSLADYAHLRLNGAKVTVGEEVRAGQIIGYSGNTGWSTRPHLHFQVYKAVKFGTQTLPVRFLTEAGAVETLKEQVNYRAVYR